MRKLLNPRWLLIVNTLPMVLLFLFYTGEYSIVRTLLSDENIELWKRCGIVLGILGAINLCYVAYLTLADKKVSIWYAGSAFAIYVLFISWFLRYAHDIIPSSIPEWMLGGESILYMCSFMMPTIVYCLLVAVLDLTPPSEERSAWKNLLAAIMIPGFWLIVFRLEVFSGFGGPGHLIITILWVCSTALFLFLLVRAVLIIAERRMSGEAGQYELLWKIPLAIVLPVAGLYVNGKIVDFRGGLFGEFGGIWFYVLAVVNGILVCLPRLEKKPYRICLFIGRSVTFAYTFYFFLVFLPFLPLSIIAIVLIGTGFLMLTPLVLFVVHTNELSADYTYLRSFFSRPVLQVISAVCFLVIPACVTVSHLHDKKVLAETLEYMYSPDYSKTYAVNRASLENTINTVKLHKESNRDFESNSPYLSLYFNWLVMDNMTLSDKKIEAIEKVFFDKEHTSWSTGGVRQDTVKITGIQTSSRYDTRQNAWISKIDLEITNKGGALSEYASTIDLPDGCWVSDYYLYVGEKKEPGILAEKKAAMWIFSQIRNMNRDPGILYYLTGNKVAFRVFPFGVAEKRRTGIELLHKEPVTLMLDSNVVTLGTAEETKDATIEEGGVAYISAKQKSELEKVQRKPYFHFIVDVSDGKASWTKDFTKRIDKLCTTHGGLAENARISFVNTFVQSVPLKDDWKEKYTSQDFEGGFYLERGIKQGLFDAYKNGGNTYPVIVVVTDTMAHAVLQDDFSDFKIAFPESPLFFELDESGVLKPHSLVGNPKQPLRDSATIGFGHEVLRYTLKDNSTVYLPNDNKPSIALQQSITDKEGAKEKNWQTALLMQAKWTNQIFHPEAGDAAWRELIRYSFASKILSPASSYLVVENEAQKAMLNKKQKLALQGKKDLDLGEDTMSMDEPGLAVMALLLGIVVLYKQRIKKLALPE